LFGRNPVFALLGSNGAGKTTIVKILTAWLKRAIGKPEKK
jgi:ABC-type multidrug transport system ATPase subunit